MMDRSVKSLKDFLKDVPDECKFFLDKHYDRCNDYTGADLIIENTDGSERCTFEIDDN